MSFLWQVDSATFQAAAEHSWVIPAQAAEALASKKAKMFQTSRRLLEGHLEWLPSPEADLEPHAERAR